MRCRSLLIPVFLGAVFVSLEVVSTYAATITLTAIQDAVITPNTTLNTTPNNGIINVQGGSTSNANLPTTQRKYGMLEFDLSGITNEITGATLQLFMLNGTAPAANSGLTTQIAVAFPLTASLDETTLTFSGANGFTTRADLAPAEVALTGLGFFPFSGPVTTGVYVPSNAASPGDVLFLENVRNSLFKHAGFLLNSNSNSSSVWHQWADHESGFGAQLVLTVVPEPSSGVMAIIGLSYCAFLARRKKGAV